MEAGKWIIFAALAGAVLVGFKTRQLKSYEFVVCGLFVLLLDGLVFKGQISRWIGDLGASLPHVTTSLSPGMAVWLSPAHRQRLAAVGRRLWEHRPHWSDYLVLAIAMPLAHYLLGWSWWFGLFLLIGLAAMVVVNCLLDTFLPRAGAARKPDSAHAAIPGESSGQEEAH
ncbi:hypothetical protein [Nonomuraea dietziae]|uniref:hypothetical protein n=1 Tax=Nonomuraea dietziae TaxID=65515 RepID=UPI003433D285